jgi:hypothetical protein
MPEQNSDEHPENSWIPQTVAEKRLVRNELENILRDPLFLASKRYPTFLRYVVEETLEGRGEQLKERTLGIEVFGREADYDSGQDNVVRATATETRKRLAQYYAGLKETSEIRIALVAGSYIPKFYKRLPAVEPPPRRLWPRVALALLVALILGVIGVVGWRMLRRPEDPVTLFWRPIVDWNGAILLCMGSRESRRDIPPTQTKDDSNPAKSPAAPQSDDPYIRLSNAITLARFVGFLESRGKMFHVQHDSLTSFADLRSGPAILIGANEWALRLTAPLRFSIKWDPATHTGFISDRQNPLRRDWASDWSVDPSLNQFDYALISRFVDPTTGQWLVVASGLHRFGTAASAEFLSSPELMQMLAAKAPPGWSMMNLQFVIDTKIIQRGPGRPRILESYFWSR